MLPICFLRYRKTNKCSSYQSKLKIRKKKKVKISSDYNFSWFWLTLVRKIDFTIRLRLKQNNNKISDVRLNEGPSHEEFESRTTPYNFVLFR